MNVRKRKLEFIILEFYFTSINIIKLMKKIQAI